MDAARQPLPCFRFDVSSLLIFIDVRSREHGSVVRIKRQKEGGVGGGNAANYDRRAYANLHANSNDRRSLRTAFPRLIDFMPCTWR